MLVVGYVICLVLAGELIALNVTNLGDKVIQLLLGLCVFLGHFLVLGLPLIAGGLESLDLALVVAGLDVGLTESVVIDGQHMPHSTLSIAHPDDILGVRMIIGNIIITREYTLFIRLAQILVILLGLLLQQLQLAGQGVVLGAVLRGLVGGILGLAVHLFQLLHLLLEHAVLVLEGGDFLLFGQVFLLECLDLGGELLDFARGLVGLDAESIHALGGGKSEGQSEVH